MKTSSFKHHFGANFQEVAITTILWFCALALLNSLHAEAFQPHLHPIERSATRLQFSSSISSTSRLRHLLSSPTPFSASSKKDIFKHAITQRHNGKAHASELKARPSPVLSSSPTSSDKNDDKKQQFYVYKDDCFGFITFLGGIASQDVVFTAIFVVLSLGAEVLARSKVLPPDPKRPSIVDRKVAGVLAILTLLLTLIVYSIDYAHFLDSLSVGVDGLSLPSPPPDVDLAQRVQLALCAFSAVTSLGDIRWRDRFDYGPEDQV